MMNGKSNSPVGRPIGKRNAAGPARQGWAGGQASLMNARSSEASLLSMSGLHINRGKSKGQQTSTLKSGR